MAQLVQQVQMGSPSPLLQPLLVLSCSIVAVLLLQQPRGAEAGFACLSSPCVYGICMDDLNR